MATSNGIVAGPMGAQFGRDPVEFFVNVIRREKANFAKVTARCSHRTGITRWTTNPRDGKAFSSTMRAKSSDSVQQVALVCALWCIKNPGLFLDEAGRVANSMSVGPKVNSLDGSVEVNKWPEAWGTGTSESGEPITLIAIMTIAVPIIVALAPIVLPIIIALVGSGVKAATDVIGGLTGNKEVAPLPPEEDEIFGIPMDFLLLGAAGVAGYFLFVR